MAATRTRLLLSLCLLAMFLAADASKFERPSPRPVISVPHLKDDSHPQQVHISAVGKDRMTVSYVTEDRSVPSLVEYGTAPGKYSNAANGNSTSYKFFMYHSDKIHYVTIGPLLPSTLYFYRCGGAGAEFSFRTPPATLPVEFAVMGDLGQTDWTAATLAQLNASDYDMLLLPGDLAYADFLQPLWDSFGRLVEPYASRRPWMVNTGNHEVESLQVVGPEPFLAYNARWRMPHEQSGSASNLYYSFDVAGSVHVIMLGSYTDFGPGSDQMRWLEVDLAKVDRARTPWLIVIIHAPWYNTNAAHQGEGEEMRLAMEELVYRARADIVFAGHVHAYERFRRVYNNAGDPCGPVHITIGDGGNREGLARKFDKSHKAASLSVFREASFGHARLRVVNATHARWSWHRNDDAFAVVKDDIWVQSLSASSCFPHRSPRVTYSDEL